MMILILTVFLFVQTPDCSQAPASTRVFAFNPVTGSWRFDDSCSGASRQGVGQVTRQGHIWTVTDFALLAVWDDRKRTGLAAVFGREGSDQWQPITSRFRIVWRVTSKGR